MKRILALLMAMIMCMTILVGCGTKQEAPAQDDAAAQGDASGKTEDAGTTEETAEKKDILFYGKIVEYSSGEPTCEKLEEIMADKYNIESLQVDWGNLEQVIRTGIASGDPCDIYNYWPKYIETLANDGLCLDLTPYLDADGGAWRNTFNPEMLKLGEVDGKIYAVPTTPNFIIALANKELFDQAGVDLPENGYWAWDDFLSDCEKFLAAGIFPMAVPTDNQKSNTIWESGVYALAQDAGLIEEIKNNEVPYTHEIFEEAFTRTKDLYDNEYLYPGEGAVSLTSDESRAAFAQGKVAICVDLAAGASGVVNSLDFETVIIPMPSMGSQTVGELNSDGLFIPANVKDVDAAIEVLKAYTSPEVQIINCEHGFAVATAGLEPDDPTAQQLIEIASNVTDVGSDQMLSSELTDYKANQVLAEIVLGGGVESAMEILEGLRQEALGN